MKLQNKILPRVFFLFALAFGLASCSGSALDTPVKASSINEYVKSVTDICKKLDKQEKERFLSALKAISGDTFKAATMIVLTGGIGSDVRFVADAIKPFDGKTPREIMAEAEGDKTKAAPEKSAPKPEENAPQYKRPLTAEQERARAQAEQKLWEAAGEGE